MVKDTPFQNYLDTFIQRIPRYTVKSKQGWRTKNKALSDMPIKAHLGGTYVVGVLSRWYPQYAILDIDARPREKAEEIRLALGLDESNSMMCASESANSYHVLTRPHYNGNPPTIRLLHKVLDGFGDRHGIEIFPQAQRAIRLPFGPHQNCLDPEYAHLDQWVEKLYWYAKLEDFDLSLVKDHQMELDLRTSVTTLALILQEGNELLKHGLQLPSSRHESQFKVLYLFWRLNVTQEQAETTAWHWIQRKHNGFSKDILRYPGAVRKEITRQANTIWGKYELSKVYPDDTHNSHGGYLAEPDLRDIIQICGGSTPRMRFLFHLVKYCYPRRHRNQVNIHRDKLVQWGNERTYLKYLNELETKGIAQRGRGYEVGGFSKSLRLDWKYKDSRKAVLYEGRAIETFEDTVKVVYSPRDFRALLQSAGTEKNYARRFVERTFQSRLSATHI